jgi:hypothetical protein
MEQIGDSNLPLSPSSPPYSRTSPHESPNVVQKPYLVSWVLPFSTHNPLINLKFHPHYR